MKRKTAFLPAMLIATTALCCACYKAPESDVPTQKETPPSELAMIVTTAISENTPYIEIKPLTIASTVTPADNNSSSDRGPSNARTARLEPTPQPDGVDHNTHKALATRAPEQPSVPTATASPTEAPSASTAPPKTTVQTAEATLALPQDSKPVTDTEPPTSPAATDPPVKTQPKYTDAAELRESFMDAINLEKAANDAPEGSLSSALNDIAQDRARQMAAANDAWHIGSGYSETVGSMSSARGVANKGRNAVHHCPDLMECTSFGVGVAQAADGLYYYSIIGE